MTIVSIQTGTGAELRRIGLSDGSCFSFKTCYAPPAFIDAGLCTPGLAEGQEISADAAAGFRFASACLRAEQAALRLIARAEQSVWGLSCKLEQRGHEAACVSAVVSRLVDMGLLDDRRFARLWIESRLRLARSPRRILAGLRARGIGRDDAGAALNAVLDAEAEFALVRRFAAKARRSPAADTVRSLQFALKNEGFSPAAIERFLDAEESHETQ